MSDPAYDAGQGIKTPTHEPGLEQTPLTAAQAAHLRHIQPWFDQGTFKE